MENGTRERKNYTEIVKGIFETLSKNGTITDAFLAQQMCISKRTYKNWIALITYIQTQPKIATQKVDSKVALVHLEKPSIG